MERRAWAAERERLTARITSLQRAVQAREIKVAAAREAVEAERNATVRRVAARENAAVAAVEWPDRRMEHLATVGGGVAKVARGVTMVEAGQMVVTVARDTLRELSCRHRRNRRGS